MFCILLNSPFSDFESKIFNISRRIEGVNPQFWNLVLRKKNDCLFAKKKRKKEKRIP